MRLQLAAYLPHRHLMLAITTARLAGKFGSAAYLVGGPVRDALLGLVSLDLDIAIEGDVRPIAVSLAEKEGGQATFHTAFGTAVVALPDGLHVDLAMTRRETYCHPGALPQVEPAPLAEDLRRRDFTCNALALGLNHEWGVVHDPWGGQADLQKRLLRGMHDQTFVDDPTRLLRAARYAARLGLHLASETAAWLTQAASDDVLTLVSGPRIWGELRRLLQEKTWLTGLKLLKHWGLLSQIGLQHTALPWLADLEVANVALGLADVPDARLLAAVGLLAGADANELGLKWGLEATQRAALEAAGRIGAAPPAVCLEPQPSASALYEALRPLPEPALLALWATRPDTRDAIARYWQVRELEPDITGAHLVEAGCQPGPALGAALRAALAARIDEQADPQAQMDRALAAYAAYAGQS